jgi:hypothetical protein
MILTIQIQSATAIASSSVTPEVTSVWSVVSQHGTISIDRPRSDAAAMAAFESQKGFDSLPMEVSQATILVVGVAATNYKESLSMNEPHQPEIPDRAPGACTDWHTISAALARPS